VVREVELASAGGSRTPYANVDYVTHSDLALTAAGVRACVASAAGEQEDDDECPSMEHE
jgi:hypothetical protein